MGQMIEPLIIYNKFLFPWRVPSMNELVFMKGTGGKISWLLTPGKTKRNASQFNMYNQLKQDWSRKICSHVTKVGFNTCKEAYFHYLLVEPNVKRDPSNIAAAAAKFIEDGLIKAGVIENDGWKQVLGLMPYWILDRDSSGTVYLVMANQPLSKNAIISYYNTREMNEKQVQKENT